MLIALITPIITLQINMRCEKSPNPLFRATLYMHYAGPIDLNCYLVEEVLALN